MKHILFTLSLLAIATAAMASDFTVDKITYEITSQQTVSIVSADSTIQSANLMPTVTHQGITYSVTSIRERAFENCSSLTSIIIPNSVTSIGNFGGDYGCGSTSVLGKIPYRTGNVFMGCPSLTTIKVDTSNPYFDSRNNCNAIIETATNTLIAGCKTTTIPNSVTSIGSFAFQGCTSLTSVTIPKGVTSIEEWAFSGCTSLTSVTIPKGVTSIGVGAFNECSALTSVTIPKGVTSIEEWAFWVCSSLTSITIPSSVTEIRLSAFQGCTSLTSVTIPNSVTSIGGGAFNDCSALTSITVDAGNTHFDSRNNCNAIIETATNTLIAGCKTTTIPNSVTSIGSFAFQGCSSLTSITIPNSVMIIGEWAFSYCTSLSTINYTGTMEQWNKVFLGRWGYSIPAKSAICTDGCILLPKSDDDIFTL